MSIEKVFDKLDEKVSSLLRSMGLIITLLLGIIALVFNFFTFNIVIGLILLSLLVLFIVNVICTLYLYIFSSTKNDEFVSKFNSYNQLLKLFNELNLNLKPRIDYINHLYNEYQKNNENVEENTAGYMRMLTETIYIKESEEENPENNTEFEIFKNYKFTFKLKNIEYMILTLNYFRSIYFEIGKNIFKINEFTDSEELNKISQIIEIIDNYSSELLYYSEIEFKHNELRRQKFSEAPSFSLSEFLDHFRFILNQNYREMNILKGIIKKNYGRKIKFVYLMYAISIIISCVLFLFIIIKMF